MINYILYIIINIINFWMNFLFIISFLILSLNKEYLLVNIIYYFYFIFFCFNLNIYLNINKYSFNYKIFMFHY